MLSQLSPPGAPHITFALNGHAASVIIPTARAHPSSDLFVCPEAHHFLSNLRATSTAVHHGLFGSSTFRPCVLTGLTKAGSSTGPRRSFSPRKCSQSTNHREGTAVCVGGTSVEPWVPWATMIPCTEAARASRLHPCTPESSGVRVQVVVQALPRGTAAPRGSSCFSGSCSHWLVLCRVGEMQVGGPATGGAVVEPRPSHQGAWRVEPSTRRPSVSRAPDLWAGSCLASATDSGHGPGSGFAHEGDLVTFAHGDCVSLTGAEDLSSETC
ncbi:uncharacterized protein LOC101674667 [Mustela putorius furo]|uniref:Uncharacterized protein LOC101674667 n=1 Tax=Mustela putorius furo TaxID=9669 RepID=A0A8U0S5E4_MUSPF|nr:uncharacterized protein LOC101674667 [Mustela putorius furo]